MVSTRQVDFFWRARPETACEAVYTLVISKMCLCTNSVSSNANMEARAIFLQNVSMRLREQSYADSAHERSSIVAEKLRFVNHAVDSF